MLELNKIYNIDNIAGMKQIQNGFIDLTVTSPPYDNLRKYKRYVFDFESIAKELYRITKNGGVVVWIVGDSTINGSETCTGFKQALFFKEVGFNLHDTMIWFKPNAMPQVDKTRFTQSFEYMFVFSKGKPKTTNPLLIPTKNAGKIITRVSNNDQNINKSVRIDKTKDKRIAFNVWELCVGTKSFGHPAIFPEKLAEDHILSWSKKNDIVLDPFLGSGNTIMSCINKNRKYLGCEKESKYFEIIKNRIT
jgi:site-specific DNA-methyltransferase (adenine-specific)